MSAEETEYGVAGTCSYSDGGKTKFFMLMPMASYLMIVAPDPSITLDHVAWRVPIDDHSHRSLSSDGSTSRVRPWNAFSTRRRSKSGFRRFCCRRAIRLMRFCVARCILTK